MTDNENFVGLSGDGYCGGSTTDKDNFVESLGDAINPGDAINRVSTGNNYPRLRRGKLHNHPPTPTNHLINPES